MAYKTLGRQCIVFILVVGILFFTLTLVGSAYADVTYKFQVPLPGFQQQASDPCSSAASSDLAGYISAVYKFLIRIVVVLGVGAMTVAGLLWLTARGESKQIDTSISIIKNTIIGIVLALGSYAILYAINPSLVVLQNLEVKKMMGIDLDSKLSNVVTNSKNITISVCDGNPDGDRITLELNGATIFTGETFACPGKSIDVNLQCGENKFKMTAHNVGTSSPNTASLNFSSVTSGKPEQKGELLTGDSATMRIYVYTH